jgi:hypothetical protein
MTPYLGTVFFDLGSSMTETRTSRRSGMGNQDQAGSMVFECWAYKNGKPWKKTEVVASSPAEAEEMAWMAFRNIRIMPAEVVVNNNAYQLQ